MAHHAAADDIFAYTGGQVPEHLREFITHARIDESVTVIDIMAFDGCPRLLHVDFHDGVEIVRRWAFLKCPSLMGAKMPGVKIIGRQAFGDCFQLTDVEFGNKLETIEEFAFYNCHSLKNIVMPSILRIDAGAFGKCFSLVDRAFSLCSSLRRIALPLKASMFTFDDEYVR